MNAVNLKSFFLQPTNPLHRQYELLRSVFVDQIPMAQAATLFGYRYDTARTLVSNFRRHAASGSIPPFLQSQIVDDQLK